MQAPVSMLAGDGSSKAGAVLAILVGIAVLAAIAKNQPPQAPVRTN